MHGPACTGFFSRTSIFFCLLHTNLTPLKLCALIEMLPYPLLMKFDLHKISDIVHSVETVAKQEHVYGICIIVYSTWNTSDTTQVCILTVQTAEVM